MDSLVKLQLVNLMKKYDYLSAELEVKSEISSISQAVFRQNIDKVISGDPKLKEMAGGLVDIGPTTLRDGDSKAEVEMEEPPIDPEMKSIYRKIAKVTHPDKVTNDYLNRTYVDATRCIRIGDRLGLYKAAVNLGIDMDIPESIGELLVEEIRSIEKRIRFIESSYHMMWHYSSKERRIELVCEYIEKNLIRLSEA